MTVVVVDASVAVKWFLPEVHSEDAARVLGGDSALLAPDLIVAEVGNTLWKKVGRGEITRARSAEVLATLERVGIELYPTPVLVGAALELACELRCSVYDATYLALAVARDCAVITADRRFFTTAAKSGLIHRVRLIGEPQSPL